MRYTRAIIACVFLMNALCAVPYLVECIPSDGRSIIETLGHDPCHDAAVAVPPNRLGPSIAGDLDPCLDLLLDAPGAVETQSRVPVPRPGVTGHLAAPVPAAEVCAAPDRLRRPDPPARPVPDFRSPFTLRI